MNDSKIKKCISELTQQADVDYCDIRYEINTELTILIQDEDVGNVSEDDVIGGFIRALHQGKWGTTSFNSLDDVEEQLKCACEHAKAAALTAPGISRLAPVPVVHDDVAPAWTIHPREIGLDEKVRALQDISSHALQQENIITTELRYSERCIETWFASSEGSLIHQEKLDLHAILSVTMEQNGKTASHAVSVSSALGYDCIAELKDKVESLCSTTRDLLRAEPVHSGTYTVICSPEISGVLVHEAFGHLSEADSLIANPDMIKSMPIGEVFGPENLHIFDTGDQFQQHGALFYDDEGVRCRKSYLIRNGRLAGRLHSRETAALLGEEATGNARSVHYSQVPLVRMRATIMDAGDSSFEEMLRGVKHGIYAVKSGGGQVSSGTFSFNIPLGYMIRDGRLAEPIRDFSFMGNVFSTLKNIDLIGNDVSVYGSNCGKSGQSNLSVGMGAPHMRIQNATIGGI